MDSKPPRGHVFPKKVTKTNLSSGFQFWKKTIVLPPRSKHVNKFWRRGHVQNMSIGLKITLTRQCFWGLVICSCEQWLMFECHVIVELLAKVNTFPLINKSTIMRVCCILIFNKRAFMPNQVMCNFFAGSRHWELLIRKF